MSHEFITNEKRDKVLLCISAVESHDVSSLAKAKAHEWVKGKAWDMDIAEWSDEGYHVADIAFTICEIVHDGITDGTYTAEQLA